MPQHTDIDLDSVQTMAKVLGSLFYYPLTDANNQALIRALSYASERGGSVFSDWSNTVNRELPDTLEQDFFLLFEGGEILVAPPWGSLYLEQSESPIGISTLKYRQFLRDYGIEVNTGVDDPEDQFGLMLFAVSQILELRYDVKVVKHLLGHFLLPWCYRYLELVERHALSKSYRELAYLTRQWCRVVQEVMSIEVKPSMLYR